MFIVQCGSIWFACLFYFLSYLFLFFWLFMFCFLPIYEHNQNRVIYLQKLLGLRLVLFWSSWMVWNFSFCWKYIILHVLCHGQGKIQASYQMNQIHSTENSVLLQSLLKLCEIDSKSLKMKTCLLTQWVATNNRIFIIQFHLSVKIICLHFFWVPKCAIHFCNYGLESLRKADLLHIRISYKKTLHSNII